MKNCVQEVIMKMVAVIRLIVVGFAIVVLSMSLKQQQ
jgi:hypothetical protein